MNSKSNILDGTSCLKLKDKQFRKLSNIILFLSTLESRKLYLTRLLKLLYIIDEKAVHLMGLPVTAMDYKVAEKGPLADLLWYHIQNNPDIFLEYFAVKPHDSSASYSIEPVREPNLDTLSNFEMNLIHDTVKEYKGVKTEDIIDELHGEGTLWYKIVKKHNINFDKPESTSISKHLIDFHELIKHDDEKLEIYNNYLLTKS